MGRDRHFIGDIAITSTQFAILDESLNGGFSHTEIAQARGLTESNVRGTISTAMTALGIPPARDPRVGSAAARRFLGRVALEQITTEQIAKEREQD